jgi:hypothetical protein
MQPDWFRIIKNYPDLTNGPTIPFLLGALRPDPDAVLPDEESKEELRALVQAMRREMPAANGVEIERCGPLDAHVFGLRSGGGLKFKDMYPYDVHDDESLVDALWSMYGEPISTREFSREKADPIKGTKAFWRPFSPGERQTVDDVLGR